MLEWASFVFAVLWLLGMTMSFTAGGWIHVLPVASALALLAGEVLNRGRR